VIRGYAADRPASEYPRLIVSVLIECKRKGIPFALAWKHATQKYPPRTHGFGSYTRGGTGTESPLLFFRRHAEAAYNDDEPQRYCASPTCARLAERDGYCKDHAEEEAA
jgi:hypothetical protein